MKLRNKKTGEIKMSVQLGWFDGTPEKYFYSLKEVKSFLGDWEDYAPAEPLIKDEKIRKVVRAWAEINGFDKVTYEYDVEFAISSFSVGYVAICFFDCFALLENGKDYTIPELCGEEGECEN